MPPSARTFELAWQSKPLGSQDSQKIGFGSLSGCRKYVLSAKLVDGPAKWKPAAHASDSSSPMTWVSPRWSDYSTSAQRSAQRSGSWSRKWRSVWPCAGEGFGHHGSVSGWQHGQSSPQGGAGSVGTNFSA